MAGQRMFSWVPKHIVGFYFGLAVLWLAFAAFQAILIVEEGPGTNGMHVFGVVVGLVTSVLSATSAIVVLIAKRKKTWRG